MKGKTIGDRHETAQKEGKGFFSTRHSLPSTVSSRGFSLIELIVVIAIVAVISTLILARYGQFNGQVLLRNLGYDIALSIRQAQVYTISGKVGSATSGVQYGVYIDRSTPTQYLIFADYNGNRAYDAASGEATEIYTVRSGYTISDFCADAGSTASCVSAGPGLNYLTVMFKRPDPDAYIKTNLQSSGYTQARIIARSPSGDTRTVTVTLTGQISVEQGIN